MIGMIQSLPVAARVIDPAGRTTDTRLRLGPLGWTGCRNEAEVGRDSEVFSLMGHPTNPDRIRNSPSDRRPRLRRLIPPYCESAVSPEAINDSLDHLPTCLQCPIALGVVEPLQHRADDVELPDALSDLDGINDALRRLWVLPFAGDDRIRLATADSGSVEILAREPRTLVHPDDSPALLVRADTSVDGAAHDGRLRPAGSGAAILAPSRGEVESSCGGNCGDA